MDDTVRRQGCPSGSLLADHACTMGVIRANSIWASRGLGDGYGKAEGYYTYMHRNEPPSTKLHTTALRKCTRRYKNPLGRLFTPSSSVPALREASDSSLALTLP